MQAVVKYAIEISLLASDFNVPNKTKTVTLRILRTFTLEMAVQKVDISPHAVRIFNCRWGKSV
jgi:hypothetical protein